MKFLLRPLILYALVPSLLSAQDKPHVDSKGVKQRLPATDGLPAGFNCGALAEVIRQNGGMIPKTKVEWEAALAKFGFKRVEVTFSKALGRSDLANPRFVYMIEQTNHDLPNLTNDLFIGLGTDLDGKSIVEFFSKNPIHGGYDVGTIHPEAENFIHIEAMDRCSRCHHSSMPPDNYIGDLEGWEKALRDTNPKIHQPARQWLETVTKRVLIDQDMPPKKAYEAKHFDTSIPGQELIDFLKKHGKK